MGYHPLYQEIYLGNAYQKSANENIGGVPFTNTLEQIDLKFGGKIGNFLENVDKEDLD